MYQLHLRLRFYQVPGEAMDMFVVHPSAKRVLYILLPVSSQVREVTLPSNSKIYTVVMRLGNFGVEVMYNTFSNKILKSLPLFPKVGVTINIQD